MHIMVDIETLAVTPDACILTIAAQQFSPFIKRDYSELRHFYSRISIESQKTRAVNENTVEWWATQSAQAQEEAFSENNRISLQDALKELSPLIWQSDFMWINDPTFEVNILEDAYKSFDLAVPWKFYLVRDARTVYSLHPELKRPPATHHALEDCRRQIEMLQQTFTDLSIEKIV